VRDYGGVVGKPFSLVARDVERGGVGAGDAVVADERGAVGVAAGGEDLVHGVAERQDQHPPVIKGVVEREDRRFLAAVWRVRGGEAGRDLVGEFSLLPEASGLVDELLELGGDVSEARWCAEGNAVGPFEVVEGGCGCVGNAGAMSAPVLVL
jgi:hypothetical protein